MDRAATVDGGSLQTFAAQPTDDGVSLATVSDRQLKSWRPSEPDITVCEDTAWSKIFQANVTSVAFRRSLQWVTEQFARDFANNADRQTG